MIFQWLLAHGLCFFAVWVLGQLHSRCSRVWVRLVGICAILRTRPSASESRLSGRAPKEEETRWPGRHLGNSVNVAEWWDFADERMSGVRQLSPFFRHVSSVLHFLLLSVPRDVDLVKKSDVGRSGGAFHGDWTRPLRRPGGQTQARFSGWARRDRWDPSELGEFRAGVAPTHFLFEAYRQA